MIAKSKSQKEKKTQIPDTLKNHPLIGLFEPITLNTKKAANRRK